MEKSVCVRLREGRRRVLDGSLPRGSSQGVCSDENNESSSWFNPFLPDDVPAKERIQRKAQQLIEKLDASRFKLTWRDRRSRG